MGSLAESGEEWAEARASFCLSVSSWAAAVFRSAHLLIHSIPFPKLNEVVTFNILPGSRFLRNQVTIIREERDGGRRQRVLVASWSRLWLLNLHLRRFSRIFFRNHCLLRHHLPVEALNYHQVFLVTQLSPPNPERIFATQDILYSTHPFELYFFGSSTHVHLFCFSLSALPWYWCGLKPECLYWG